MHFLDREGQKIITIDELFKATTINNATLKIKGDKVQVYVSPANDDSTATGQYVPSQIKDKDGNVLCSHRNNKEYVQSNVMEIQFNEHKRKPIVTTMQYLVNDFAIIDKPKPKVFVIENVDAFDMHKQQDKIEIINTEEENRNVIHNEYYCYINNSSSNSIERDKLNQRGQSEYKHNQSRNVNNLKCVTSRNKRNKMLYTPPMTYVNSYNDNNNNNNVNTNSYMYHNEKSKMSFIKLNKVKEKTYGDIHKDKIKSNSNSNNKTYKQMMQPYYYNYPLAKGNKDICNNELLSIKNDNNVLYHQYNHQLVMSDDVRNDSLDKGLQYLEERLKEYSQSIKQTDNMNRNAQHAKQQEIFFIPSTDSRHGSCSDKVNNDCNEGFNDKVKKRELVTVDDFISLQQQQPEVIGDNYNNNNNNNNSNDNNDDAIPFHLIKRETMYSNLINYIFGSGKVSSKKLMK